MKNKEDNIHTIKVDGHLYFTAHEVIAILHDQELHKLASEFGRVLTRARNKLSS